MDVKVMLNPQQANSTGSSADLSVGDSSGSGDRGFSDHLEKNVDRLNNERAEPASTAEKKPEKLENIRALADSDNVQKTTSSPDTVTGEKEKLDHISPVSEGLPKGLNDKLEEVDLLEQAPGLSTAIGVISDKRNLSADIKSASISGNELPLAADVETMLNDGEFINKDMPDQEIVFDPLSQAKESSVQIAALTAGHLPTEKVRFNGKNTEGDFFSSLSVPLSLGKFKYTDTSNLVLDGSQKMAPEINSVAALAKEIGSVKVATGIGGSASDVAALMIGAGQREQVLMDKPNLQLNTPVNSPNWAENFSQRVQWMVNQSMSGAQIRLNPQHMGPIEVRIQMQNEQATVSFTAQHGATREAIDAALPRLREMFNEQNVNVVDIDVSQHSFAEQREQASNNHEETSTHLSELDGEAEDSIFDQHDNGKKQQVYTGLFSEFA